MLWLVILVVLGGVAGYIAAARQAGSRRDLVAIVGAVYGAFVGCLMLLASSGASRPMRRVTGAIAGVATSCITGLMLGASATMLIDLSIALGVAGALGEFWVRHINIP